MSRQDCKHCREASDLFPLDSCSPPIDRAAPKAFGVGSGFESRPTQRFSMAWVYILRGARRHYISRSTVSADWNPNYVWLAVLQPTEWQRTGNQIDAARTSRRAGFR